jgi:hypothetical protein
MADNVLVIPSTIRVGRNFPPYLPLPNGDLKASQECTPEDVANAVGECQELAEASRVRLQEAYQEHIKDIELFAQVSAYNEKFEQWEAIRTGGEPKDSLWQIKAEQD